MPRRRTRRAAFTLVETLAAAAVLALIAGLLVSTLDQLGRSRAASRARADAWTNADRAAQMVQRSVLQTLRRFDLAQTRLLIRDGGRGDARDSIAVLARGLEPVRPVDQLSLRSDGGEFEIGYRVVDGADGPALWRRRDMAFDEFQDAGGVATEVAAGIASLSILAADAEGYYAEWDSDALGLPHMVVIEVVARSADGRATATARRVASLPRVHAQATLAETLGGGAP
ncbi:MAG: hypothetical protein AAFX79_05490 [Planctomycetota bacterium]